MPFPMIDEFTIVETLRLVTLQPMLHDVRPLAPHHAFLSSAYIASLFLTDSELN